MVAQEGFEPSSTGFKVPRVASYTIGQKKMDFSAGIEPADWRFADACLPTWRREENWGERGNQTLAAGFTVQRALTTLLSPLKLVRRDGIEPPTSWM